MANMGNISFFTSSPRRLRNNLGIGTTIYDRHDRIAKTAANLLTRSSATLVFDCIMQQGRNSLVLVAPLLKNNTGHPQQMSNIWNSCPLTPLPSMQLRRKYQCFLEPR